MPRRLPASEAGQPVMDMTLSVTMTIESRVTKRESDGTAWIAMTFDDLVCGPLSMSGAGVPESGSPLAHGRVTATRDLAEEVQDLVTDRAPDDGHGEQEQPHRDAEPEHGPAPAVGLGLDVVGIGGTTGVAEASHGSILRAAVRAGPVVVCHATNDSAAATLLQAWWAVRDSSPR